MTYDAADGIVLLFGGTGASNYPSSFPFHDYTTWEFSAGTWSHFDLVPSPSPRAGAGMVFDTHDGYVLLFGGFGLNDTWKFSHGAWSQLHPKWGPKPGYTRVDIAYDRGRGDVVVFAGPHTWAFAAGQWKDVTHYTRFTGPPYSSASDTEMTYDSHDSYVVLWLSFSAGNRGETWKFVAGNWTNITSSVGSGPPPRAFAVFVDDPAAGYSLLFGGVSGSVGMNDSWSFSSGRWSRLAPTSSPPAEWFSSAAFDNSSRTILLHPGSMWNTAPEAATWSDNAGNWTKLQIFMTGGPPARSHAAMAGNILFGGCGTKQCPLADTWEFEAYSGSPATWVNLTSTFTTSPPPRYDATFLYIPNSNRILLFGGTDGKKVFSDTWLLQLGLIPTWKQLTKILPISPQGRYGAAAAVNPPKQDILFGGTNGSAFFGDTWSFTLAHGWTHLVTTLAPPPRASGVLVWEQINHIDAQLVLFGGTNGSNRFTDTWDLHLGAWSQEAKSNPSRLASIGAGAGGQDYHTGSVGTPFIAFGGMIGTHFSNLTWGYHNDNWTLLRVGMAPPARSYAVVEWGDWDYGDILMFGGVGPSGLLADTWEISIP